MVQTIQLYALLTDIDLLNVSRESIFFKSDGKLFQATALYGKTIFSVNLNLVLGVLRHLEQIWYCNRVLN